MTVRSDSEAAEPSPADAPVGSTESSALPGQAVPARIVERLEIAIASAEQTLLGPLHRFQERRAGPRQEEARPRREPIYVSYLKLPRAGPITALVVLMVGYVAVFGTLTYQQQSNYGTYGFDMGIYDQGIWLLSHFHNPFVTIRGLDYFGHHVNLVTLLFVPAYWLGAGPHFLYAVETAWLAAGAIPLWLLGRERLQSAWLAVGLSAGVPALSLGRMDQLVAVPPRRARSSPRSCSPTGWRPSSAGAGSG